MTFNKWRETEEVGKIGGGFLKRESKKKKRGEKKIRQRDSRDAGKVRVISDTYN